MAAGSTYTDDDFPRRAEDPVDGKAGERGEQAVLRAQLRQEGIRHGLGDNHEPHGEAYSLVSDATSPVQYAVQGQLTRNGIAE